MLAIFIALYTCLSKYIICLRCEVEFKVNHPWEMNRRQKNFEGEKRVKIRRRVIREVRMLCLVVLAIVDEMS
jgi:hypothetical protein